MLTREQADVVEENMRKLEADPLTTKRDLRLFMQDMMPCGHAAGNLLTCSLPPYGCVVCNENAALRTELAGLRQELEACKLGSRGFP